MDKSGKQPVADPADALNCAEEKGAPEGKRKRTRRRSKRKPVHDAEANDRDGTPDQPFEVNDGGDGIAPPARVLMAAAAPYRPTYPRVDDIRVQLPADVADTGRPRLECLLKRREGVKPNDNPHFVSANFRSQLIERLGVEIKNRNVPLGALACSLPWLP